MPDPLILKKGRDKSVRQGHPWIFSGAIATGLSSARGELREVHSHQGELLGWAYAQNRSSIAARMISWGSTDPLAKLHQSAKDAIELRRNWFAETNTTGIRLVNGEGDFLPGLIVDRYADCLVVQSTTLGMDLLLDDLLPPMITATGAQRVLNKSIASARKCEGLTSVQKWMKGSPSPKIAFQEYGLHFLAEVEDGQKTGFFLDQREMRKRVQELAKERKILNCFSYSGAFSIAALAGQAQHVTSVDVSDKALNTLHEHLQLNSLPQEASSSVQADVFEYLRSASLDFDLVILDPPAFAKKRQDVISACRGYKDINRLAMRGMPKNSLLLTCSCSHHVDRDLFQKVVFQAATEAGRQVRIIDQHHPAIDHPVNLAHPEGNYLKSLLLHIA